MVPGSKDIGVSGASVCILLQLLFLWVVLKSGCSIKDTTALISLATAGNTLRSSFSNYIRKYSATDSRD
jgi:hypothetical protein